MPQGGVPSPTSGPEKNVEEPPAAAQDHEEIKINRTSEGTEEDHSDAEAQTAP